MCLKQQYGKWLRLKEEVDLRLARGTDFQRMKELILFLGQEQTYLELRQKEGRMMMLDCFLGIWLEEKRILQQPGIAEDIFYQVGSLSALAHKYRQILYCALRIENKVPESYVKQAITWLLEQRISGVAIGKIVILETKEKEDNLLHIAQALKKEGATGNALLLLAYANRSFPGRERLILEEADCRIQIQHWEKAYELLKAIENPTAEIRDILAILRQVIKNG